MSEAQHTSRPREVCEPGDYGDYSGNCIVVIGDDRRRFIVLGSDDQSKANASLIGALPDLVRVAVKLRTALNALRPFPIVVEPVAAALIAEADAALAKAGVPLMDEMRSEVKS